MIDRSYTQKLASNLSFVSFFISFIIIFIINFDKSMMSFYYETRDIALILSPIFVLITIFFGYRYSYIKRSKNEKFLEWLYGSLALGITYSIVVTSLVFIGFEILNQTFGGLSLDKFTSTFLLSLYLAVLVYWLFDRILNIGVSNVINLVFLITAGGTFWSMITNENYTWWQNSLSYLGRDISNSNTVFNLAFIFSGLSMIMLSEFILEDIKKFIKDKKSNPKYIWLARGIIYLLGISVFLIGAFPWGASDLSTIIHNVSAFGAVGIFMVLTIGIRLFTKNYSNSFYTKSFVIGLFMIFTTIFSYISPSLNVVGSELIIFVLSGIWIILFLNENKNITSEKL